jgi:hypothetical protein
LLMGYSCWRLHPLGKLCPILVNVERVRGGHCVIG